MIVPFLPRKTTRRNAQAFTRIADIDTSSKDADERHAPLRHQALKSLRAMAEDLYDAAVQTFVTNARRHMPLWKMEQIAPYFEREGNHATHNPLGVKLVKDCLTNSEIGTISFIEKGGSYNEENITTPTIMAHTLAVAKLPAYRQENPDMYSYEKAAKVLYGIYWSNLSCWGKLHRICYRWSLPTIAGSLILLLTKDIVPYLLGCTCQFI